MASEHSELIAEARKYLVQFGYRNTLTGRLVNALENAETTIKMDHQYIKKIEGELDELLWRMDGLEK